MTFDVTILPLLGSSLFMDSRPHSRSWCFPRLSVHLFLGLPHHQCAGHCLLIYFLGVTCNNICLAIDVRICTPTVVLVQAAAS